MKSLGSGFLPIGLSRPGRLVLLPLRGGDLAFDGEGNAIRAGHAEAGGIAADLEPSTSVLSSSAIPDRRERTLRAWQVCGDGQKQAISEW
jgi:hypothetical protein